MTILRRFLVLAALFFWLGGFTFYVGVAVPVGTAVLGSALRQGYITRQVTVWLNVAGAVGLAVLAVELWPGRDPSARRRWTGRACWLIMTACQVLLFWLHGQLDHMMQPRGLLVHDPETFYLVHRVYLWAHTVQWTAGVVVLLLLLLGWRHQDRAAGAPSTVAGIDSP